MGAGLFFYLCPNKKWHYIWCRCMTVMRLDADQREMNMSRFTHSLYAFHFQPLLLYFFVFSWWPLWVTVCWYVDLWSLKKFFFTLFNQPISPKSIDFVFFCRTQHVTLSMQLKLTRLFKLKKKLCKSCTYSSCYIQNLIKLWD